MTRCESEPVEGGRYHYVLVIPEHGPMAWHGKYTAVDRPARLDADECIMGNAEPDGPPTTQWLTFEATGDGFTLMTMHVDMPRARGSQSLMEESATSVSNLVEHHRRTGFRN